ncbi:PPE family protein, partial [Mycobacterium kansasii]|uniref:PPE family protein n=1 Tax=Mycobacterium kansasii TaxID=1768 RepID=UPI0011564337
MNNGILWRADSHGLLGATYTITIPEIPAALDVKIPINIPITASITPINIAPFGIDPVPFSGMNDGLGGDIEGWIGPIAFSPIVLDIANPAINLNIGNPDGSTVIDIGGTAGLGPIQMPLVDIPATPGFFNFSGPPSSGFFNSGTGSSSGFFNIGANNSGLRNISDGILGNSGFNNVGALQSGLTNLGNGISGWGNVSPLDFSDSATISGFRNAGTDLAGLLRDGANSTTFNIGLENLGALNLGSVNTGDLNLGSGNAGSFNGGSANIGSLNLGSANIGSL